MKKVTVLVQVLFFIFLFKGCSFYQWRFPTNINLDVDSLCVGKVPEKESFGLIIWDGRLSYDKSKFSDVIKNYQDDLRTVEGVQSIECPTWGLKGYRKEYVQKIIDHYKGYKNLHSVVLVGDFEIPVVKSSRVPDFKSYYIYQGLEKEFIAKRKLGFYEPNFYPPFYLGVIPCKEVTSCKRYFKRLHKFRHGKIKYHNELSVSYFTDREEKPAIVDYKRIKFSINLIKSAYEELAETLNLKLKINQNFSDYLKDEGYEKKLDNIYDEIRDPDKRFLVKKKEFKDIYSVVANNGLLNIIQHHGGSYHAGCLDIDDQFPGGAYITVMHSCSSGLELAPKMLLGEHSKRLIIVSFLNPVFVLWEYSGEVLYGANDLSPIDVFNILSSNLSGVFYGDPFLNFKKKWGKKKFSSLVKDFEKLQILYEIAGKVSEIKFDNEEGLFSLTKKFMKAYKNYPHLPRYTRGELISVLEKRKAVSERRLALNTLLFYLKEDLKNFKRELKKGNVDYFLSEKTPYMLDILKSQKIKNADKSTIINKFLELGDKRYKLRSKLIMKSYFYHSDFNDLSKVDSVNIASKVKMIIYSNLVDTFDRWDMDEDLKIWEKKKIFKSYFFLSYNFELYPYLEKLAYDFLDESLDDLLTTLKDDLEVLANHDYKSLQKSSILSNIMYLLGILNQKNVNERNIDDLRNFVQEIIDRRPRIR